MKEKRQQIIVDMLQKNSYITIAEFVKALGVSASTVRRDLDLLAAQRKVLRNKSGASPYLQYHEDPALAFRAVIHAESKMALAQAAVGLLKNDSVIFLDSSSTALNMTPLLRKMPKVIVVTNSLMVAVQLENSPVTVHLLAGEISASANSATGPLAEQALLQYNLDFAFISPVGVTPNGYVSLTTPQTAAIRRVAMRQAACRVLLYDASKVGVQRVYNIGHLNDFDYIVTDAAQLSSADTTATILSV